jgi:pyruvate ferredoxin oxidoreductase gamma subunit
MYQVRLHGRGGQGVVTAAELIATAAIAQGRYALAFPSFGSERTGAPVAAYCRIDDEPIRSREPIADPDAVVVLDATLLSGPAVFEGVKTGTTVLVNAAAPVPAAIEAACPAPVRTVPATGFAQRRTGRAVPNAAMVGAFAAATGAVSLDAVLAAIRERFAGRIAEPNCLAAADAHHFALRDAAGRTVGAPDIREPDHV